MGSIPGTGARAARAQQILTTHQQRSRNL